MSDFAISWRLTRQRLLDEIKHLNQEQLNWRIHPKALTIAESAMHVAAVEFGFVSQLVGRDCTEEELRFMSAAHDGIANDKPFPFATDELTPEFVQEMLEFSGEVVEPVITKATPETRLKQVKGVITATMTGQDAFARLAFHAAYHQGQAYLIRTSPDFPK